MPVLQAAEWKELCRLHETCIFVDSSQPATIRLVFTAVRQVLPRSSKNLLGLGFFKVHRQHHMNTYCRTDACKVEGPRSLHFKTMWAGKKSFKDFQDRPNVWVPAMLETPGNNLGPSQVKFFTWWTTLHAWQVHMNVNTCPTPPPTKRHGHPRAVVQLYTCITSISSSIQELAEHAEALAEDLGLEEPQRTRLVAGAQAARLMAGTGLGKRPGSTEP